MRPISAIQVHQLQGLELNKWSLIEELGKLRDKERFRAGSKLKQTHLDRKSAKTWVSVANSTVLNSIVAALGWRNKDQKLNTFEESIAALHFIYFWNDFFDAFNLTMP